MLGKQDGGLESNVKKIEEGGRATKQQLNSTKVRVRSHTLLGVHTVEVELG